MNEAESFPLCWPSSYPRTLQRKRSPFRGATFFTAVKEIHAEIKRLGGERAIVSTNIPIRKDGLPYSNAGRIHDPGVAVYFALNDRPVVLACDKWERLEDNAHAIAKSIDAMRGLDRWGVSDILERAFQGFLALPAPAQETPWWEVLHVPRSCSLEFAEDYYRGRMKADHPDRGGSHEKMVALNRAIEQARAEKQAS